MYSAQTAWKRIEERGPRFAVTGSIRSGEAVTEYAETAERAEEIRANFEDNWGYYQVAVHPPVGSVQLGPLAEARQKAMAAEREATAILRAAVLRASEDGRAEAEIAREARVDRMTVRKWLGKQ